MGSKTNPGDADLSGDAGFADFLELASNFGKSRGWADGDFDWDGEITFADFLLLAPNFGESAE